MYFINDEYDEPIGIEYFFLSEAEAALEHCSPGCYIVDGFEYWMNKSQTIEQIVTCYKQIQAYKEEWGDVEYEPYLQQ